MKKKKNLKVYLLSGAVPLAIFFICSLFNKFLPFGSQIMNIYDSFTQYPGMLLEYSRNLKSGYLFYSWNAGLGFNFFGTLTYYCLSPLNLLSVLASPKNYPYFIVFMTFLRFFLLGISMSIYLKHKKIPDKLVVLFSTIYALIGYTATYYYNYIWFDSIIMLPLVIYGLDDLLDGKSPLMYIVTLVITIMCNYYIGFMICIFCLIYFVYRLVISKDKKKKEKIVRFAISSLLAGLMCAIFIIPSYYALKTGKAYGYDKTDYSGFVDGWKDLFYMMTSGNYRTGDQGYGPPQIYSSILVLVLTVFYFFNTKYSRKEKIATGIVILFFLASFTFKGLNYAWQFFQQPIWWQSRFSFLYSFFVISLAATTMKDIKYVKFKNIYKIIATIIIVALILVGAYYKFHLNAVQTYYYFYLATSIVIFIEIMFMLDSSELFTMVMLLTVLDLSLNTFNSLKNNSKYKSIYEGKVIRDNLSSQVKKLNKENDNFYRMDFIDDYSSDDGPYFNFHGINYFNSARNINVVYMMESLGLNTTDHCHFKLEEIDPALLSLFNIKYIYGDMEYFKKVDKNIYENPYPLALGYTVSNSIKDFTFPITDGTGVNYRSNLVTMIDSMTDTSIALYNTYDYTNFFLTNLSTSTNSNSVVIKEPKKDGKAMLRLKSDGHYLLMPNPNLDAIIIRNGKRLTSSNYYYEVKKGDNITITYTLTSSKMKDDLYLTLFDINEYEKAMNILGQDILHAKTNTNGHILEGTIDINGNNNYLFTSIEYEQGMKVYVDGKKVQPDLILNTLIGLKLSKGTHKIVIDYIPKGFIPGLIISLTSLGMTIVYILYLKRRD